MTDASTTEGGWRCVFVVGGAYLVQGLIYAVGTLIIQVLAQRQVSLETQVGLLASGAIPWVLKFVVALLLDLGPSWSFRARAVLLAALQGVAALCLWGIAEVWSGASLSMLALAIGWVALNVCAASQDVLVDALALDSLAAHRPATAAAMGVGMTTGAALLQPFVIVPRYAAEGMTAALRLPVWWIAALALVSAALLWMPGRPETARDRTLARTHAPGEVAHDWGRLLWVPIVLVALTFANNTTAAVAPTFLIGELRWDIPTLNALLLPIAGVTGLVAAFGFGPVVAKLGPARAAMLASAALGVVWLAFAAASPLWSQRWVFALTAAGEGLTQQALLVGLHALALVAAARSPMPTTAFVLAMAAINLPRVLGPLVAPHALTLGWVGLWAACGLAQIVVSAGLWPLRGWNGADAKDGVPSA